MKAVFSENGMPRKLSDNGPSYDHDEFIKFITQYGINYIKTSFHYHASNGLTGKHVGIIKNVLKRATYSEKDPYSV